MTSENVVSSTSTQSDSLSIELEPIRPAPRSNTLPFTAPSRAPAEIELLRSISRKTTDEDALNLRRQLFQLYDHQDDRNQDLRHVGIVFKHLTVQGHGVGARLQSDLSTPLFSLHGWARSLIGRPTRCSPLRTLLNDFSGLLKPGEMLLVLGNPSSGCSTFLKAIGGEIHGFTNLHGEITYGGVPRTTVAERYSSEILYTGEDDLHFPTLTVRETLEFALQNTVPTHASYFQGKSRSEYIRDYLRIISKVFWLEHAMDTIIGNESIRGISGGEKKRVR